ncbi:MAG: methyltransferase domain-containing protein [Proteobacteria bacterium]|nr:methyltransferase domain-containing protein [Pseudomonadota bacterium]
MQQIRVAINKKYAAVAASATGYFKYMVGKEGALQLGYSKELLDQIPESLLNSFCGVGNPLNIETIPGGSCILDIGCGAGFDLFAASRLTGATGRVFGVDLTPEMVARARANLTALQANTCEVLEISSESLPFSDQTFDVVLSNGVINLSPDKPNLFAEIRRVLKPGGRLQFADIILDKELPPHLAAGVESWSQ